MSGQPLPKRQKTETQCTSNSGEIISEEKSKNVNYFCTLPDEIVLKILQMVVHTENKVTRKGQPSEEKRSRPCPKTNNRDIIIDVLANVSKRFRRITKDRVFWLGTTYLDMLIKSKRDLMRNEKRWERIINCIISESAREIAIRGTLPPLKPTKTTGLFGGGGSVAIEAIQSKHIIMMTITKDSIQTLSFKCPNLMLLKLSKVKIPQWPQEQNSWHRLKELTLSFNQSPNIFRGIQFHHVAPNLEKFKIEEDGCPPFILPDMTQCHKLTHIELIGGGHQSFRFPSNCDAVPFPSGLMILKAIMIDFMGDKGLDTMKVLTTIKRFSRRCVIMYEFFQNMNTICSGTIR